MSEVVRRPGAHRGRARPSWRTPLGAVVVLATLLLPVAPAVSVPGANPPGQQGQPGQPGQTGQAAPQGQPGAPEKKPEPVWTGVPGTNLAHDSYGYPWPAAPDCDESDVGSGGCVNDGLGFFQGQCTSWVAHRLGQRNGIAFTNWYEGRHWGNASEWARVARDLDYVVDKVPAIGAVGWYRRGHVSYVEDVYDDGSIVISEMNTDGHNGFHVVTLAPGDPGWPDRFLHLADVVPVDLTAPDRPAQLLTTASPARVDVTWKAPADDVGVTGYQVFRNGVLLAETDDPSYVDRQASPGLAYTYSVVANDAAGNVSRPAATVLTQNGPPPVRQRDRFLPGSATVVAAGESTAVCGRLGTTRDQRVGCRFRTLEGWRTVRTGRHVAWGLPETRAFVADRAGQIWYCRELPGARTANACLPLDLAGLSWGFDRVDSRRPPPAYASWVETDRGPVRCGTLGDRATCSALLDEGWRTRAVPTGTRPGDPLSRAFVGSRHGVAFCRNVEGRGTCTELDLRRLDWGRDSVTGPGLPHGRWSSPRATPTLCVPGAGCRVVRPARQR